MIYFSEDFAFHERIDIGNYDYTDRSFSLIQANRGIIQYYLLFLINLEIENPVVHAPLPL